MFIHIGWSSWFDQTAWSVGPCPRCRCSEAIRIGHVTKTTSLYFVTVERSEGRAISLCDYCGTRAQPYPYAEMVNVGKWNFGDGLEKLFEICAPEYEFGPLRLSTREEIEDMLRNVTRATKFSKVNLNKQWFPPLLGAVLGAMISFGMVSVLGFEDQVKPIFFAFLIGVIGGGLLGILIGGILTCRTDARNRIEYNYHKYRMDGAMLSEAAARFPGRIRRAVRSIVR